jgi:hypothetical protein
MTRGQQDRHTHQQGGTFDRAACAAARTKTTADWRGLSLRIGQPDGSHEASGLTFLRQRFEPIKEYLAG